MGLIFAKKAIQNDYFLSDQTKQNRSKISTAATSLLTTTATKPPPTLPHHHHYHLNLITFFRSARATVFGNQGRNRLLVSKCCQFVWLYPHSYLHVIQKRCYHKYDHIFNQIFKYLLSPLAASSRQIFKRYWIIKRKGLYCQRKKTIWMNLPPLRHQRAALCGFVHNL